METSFIVAALMQRLQEAVDDANDADQQAWKQAAQVAIDMAKEAGFTPLEP